MLILLSTLWLFYFGASTFTVGLKIHSNLVYWHFWSWKMFSDFFSIFCDFFVIQKYFLYSTDSKILKIEFCESGSARKNLKKLFFVSPYKWVPTNQFLELSGFYLCFHMTFMKIFEKPWNESIFVFLEIVGKSIVGVLGS